MLYREDNADLCSGFDRVFCEVPYSTSFSLRRSVIMVALCNTADHYIFMLWFVLSIFLCFFPRLISAAAHWMSAILPHMVSP